MKSFISIFILAFLFCQTAFLHGQSAEARAKFYEDSGAKAARLQMLKVDFNPDINLGFSYGTRYVRDGWCWNDRPVGIGQFEISEDLGYIGLMGVYDFTDAVGRTWRFQEVRLYVGVTQKFHQKHLPFDISVDLNWGYNWYCGNSDDNSGEFSIGVIADELCGGDRWNLGTSIYVTRNYGLETTIATWDVTHSWCLDNAGKFIWDNSFRLFWGDAFAIRRMTHQKNDASAFYSFGLRSGLQWIFREKWSLEPVLELDYIPERQVRHAGRMQKMVSGTTIWGMLKLQRRF